MTGDEWPLNYHDYSKIKETMDHTDISYKKADVYILTGFLGSGKTTLLQRILTLDTDLSNTLVVVNEFGSVGVDGSLVKQAVSSNMVELTSGCICCTLKIDLIQTMDELGKQFSPAKVFVEATGIADPAEIISAFENPLIKEQFQVVKTITVLDADFWEAREAFGQVFENQLDLADIILLNKIDSMEKHEIETVLEEVHEAAKGTRVVPTVYCTIDPEIIFCNDQSPSMQGMGSLLKPYNVSTDITNAYLQAEVPGAPEMKTDSAGYVSFSFEHHSPMDKQRFERFLEKLPLNLFRIKGMVRFKDTAAILNYVGGKADWLSVQEVSPTRLAFIGWDIDTKLFQDELNACLIG